MTIFSDIDSKFVCFDARTLRHKTKISFYKCRSLDPDNVKNSLVQIGLTGITTDGTRMLKSKCHTEIE